MKYLKYALVLALIAGAFIAGQAVRIDSDAPNVDSDHEERKSLPRLTIDSIEPDYRSFFQSGASLGSMPSQLTIKLYARNQTGDRASGRYPFRLAVNHKGVSSLFMVELLNAAASFAYRVNELDRRTALRELLKKMKKTQASEAEPRTGATISYLERGENLPEGLEYEPTEFADEVVYTATIYADVDLEPGEAGIFELEGIIPPKYIGYLIDITSTPP